jgi:hypothetical protein
VAELSPLKKILKAPEPPVILRVILPVFSPGQVGLAVNVTEKQEFV